MGVEFGADFSTGGRVGFGAIPTTPGFGAVPGFDTAPTTTGATGRQPEYHHAGSDAQDGSVGPKWPWKLYDGKYLFLKSSAYPSKEPQARFNDLPDHMAGGTAELDQLFAWIELQENEIKCADKCSHLMLDCQRPIEISWTLLALLGGLIKATPL